MKKLGKYSLPCVYRFPFKFDLDALQSEVHHLSSEFKSVYSANQGLCANHAKLAEDVHDCFYQVSLTECKTSAKDFDQEMCRQMSEQRSAGLTRVQAHKLSLSRRTDIPSLDEYNWNHPTPVYQESYSKKCVETFSSEAIRVRLVELKPGGVVTPHIDYNVNYAVRVIVPIHTNSDCVNYFWYRGKKLRFHLPADGHAYFLNVGLKHAVENHGSSSRYSLMFSLKSTSDITHLADAEDIEKINLDMRILQ